MKVEGIFNLESYSLSHKILTFEHSIHFEKKEVSKIIFDSVFFMQIPSSLRDPIIYEGNENDQNYIDHQMIGFMNFWNLSKVFVIESGENKYYIGAGRMRVE